MSSLRVLIVGASIAGPTAAYWFAKAGAHVTVIERFPTLRTNGQNVDIRTVGVTVMRKIAGMEEAVRARTLSVDGISLVGATGRPYGTVKATGNPEQQSLVSEYEILRGDLAQILFDLTKETENIHYVFGEQVASMRQKGPRSGPIRVDFAHGFPAAEFDLVVACDGATSRTRAMGLACGVRDHIKPMNSWAAFFSTKHDLVDGSRMAQAYSAMGGRFVAIGPSLSGGNQVVLMGINPRHDDDDSMRLFREAMKRGDEALKQFVARYYEGAGWKCEAAVKSMMEAQDFYANESVQVQTPTLYQGHFVLVGDAGYAPGPTGTGTSLAMAGAYVLAGEINKHKGDLMAGLRGYEDQMRPLIKELQRIPPLVPTIFAPQTAWGIWLRNTIFAFVCWTRILELSQRFFASSFADSGKYELPDYKWDPN